MPKMSFNEVCTLTMGQSPDSSTYNTQQIGLPFYQGNADFGELNPTPRVWCYSPKKVAKKDDILISVRAPIGDLNIANEECGIGRGLASIRINDKNKCDLTYLFHFLESKAHFLQEKGTGSTFKAINKDSLLGLVIPMPSIEEQKIISNDLIAVHKLINSKKTQLLALDELVKSRFIEMFGELDLSAQKSNWERLSELGTIYTGTTPSTSDESNWDGDILWITPAEMNEESFFISDTVRKITEKGAKSKSLTQMPIGTVLLSTRAPIGKVGIVAKPMTCNQGFKNFYCPDKLNSIYLYVLLKYNTQYLNSIGTGTTFKEISKTTCGNIRIPVPAMDKQNEFSEFVKLIDKSKFIVQQQIKDLEELLDSKMDEYFR